MKAKAISSILHHFSNIDDPRIEHQKKHLLPNIFFITLCAVICGADDWATVEEFGKSNEEWFTELLDLKHGIPSHDTLGRVFSLIDTDLFSECFSHWVSDLAQLSEGEVIAIDGKCLRGSIDRASNNAESLRRYKHSDNGQILCFGKFIKWFFIIYSRCFSKPSDFFVIYRAKICCIYENS